MKSFFKIISINIIIFLIIVFISNVFSYFLIDSFIFSSPKTTISGSERYRLLSNGKTDEFNKMVFKEFYQLETDYEPYIVWSRKNFSGKTITINSIGDRIHPCFDCDNQDDTIAQTHYGINFTSAAKLNNIFGVQFHPEKSLKNGEKLLYNFSQL